MIKKLLSFFKKAPKEYAPEYEFDYAKIYDALEVGHYTGYKVDKKTFFITEEFIRSCGGPDNKGKNYSSKLSH